MRFHFEDTHAPLPMTMKPNGVPYPLHCTPLGSLQMFADGFGADTKESLYHSFHDICEDTNPTFLAPRGFGGGPHDRDIDRVRFGWHDYDPKSDRFTAKAPLGYVGGGAICMVLSG